MFIFHPIFILKRGMVGKRAVTLVAYLKFIGDSDPTLQIGVEKKVANIPEIEHPRASHLLMLNVKRHFSWTQIVRSNNLLS
ncbi:MAG: hypothetical protein VSS75_006895 [Candidatus Parabeggiatoa sp.]|nr:hypothetical protein [Candidatus Parabeggiatoa sp.]